VNRTAFAGGAASLWFPAHGDFQFTTASGHESARAALGILALSSIRTTSYDALPMLALGRALQFLGLVIVPMALMFYFRRQGEAPESELMFGELAILALGAGIFLAGQQIAKH
jgi:hypothetical protein